MDGALKILIVEDERIIAKDLEGIVKMYGHQVAGLAANAHTAIEILKNASVDLVLLDINLRGESDGIDVAQHIRAHEQIPFLFITSFSDDATLSRAKETSPYGYLLKPFEDENVKVAIEMAMAAFEREQRTQPDEARPDFVIKDSIFIKDKSVYKKIKFEEILFIKADSNYSDIHIRKRKYTLRCTLKDFEEKLPAQHFERVHKSYIVNLSHIDAINSTYILIDDHQLPISREMQSRLMQQINKI